ncbi:MAG TPA: hypothetical protein VHO07_23715 [Streptosporangiaceae bacterium]|jgi:hypothetical protein|nr:hypothetical protein [Streptosporangiaceae bacterium]
MALTADASKLAVAWQNNPVGPVSSRTRTATFSSPDDPLITQDGSTLFATMASGAKSAVVSFSARTGKLKAVLAQAALSGQSSSYCGVLWADPDGRHLIIQCGTTQASIQGNLSTPIHLPRHIPASSIGFANTFAW